MYVHVGMYVYMGLIIRSRVRLLNTSCLQNGSDVRIAAERPAMLYHIRMCGCVPRYTPTHVSCVYVYTCMYMFVSLHFSPYFVFWRVTHMWQIGSMT